MSSQNTIILSGDPIRKEMKAYGSIYPGHLLDFQSSTQFKVHGTAGGDALPMIALEDENQGNGIATVYTAGYICVAGVFRPGEEAQVILADGQTVAFGGLVMSNGNGEVKAFSAQDLATSASTSVYSRRILGQAMEALDVSDSATTALASRRLHIMVW